LHGVCRDMVAMIMPADGRTLQDKNVGPESSAGGRLRRHRACTWGGAVSGAAPHASFTHPITALSSTSAPVRRWCTG
jgi:hypothetical protein